MPRDFFHGRHAGLLVPLFSLPSRESWGIGEIGDLPRLGAWMAERGLLVRAAAADQRDGRRAELAVFGDERDGDRSDLHLAGGACPTSRRSAARRCCRRPSAPASTPARGPRRRSTTAAVRTLKMPAFRAAFEHFHEHEWRRDTNRALRLQRLHRARALVARRLRALPRAARPGRGPLVARVGRAAARSRRRRARGGARGARRTRSSSTRISSGSPPTSGGRRARRASIGVFGDFPFMVSGDSADVWSRQEDFRLDASVGAPPDAFSETGQDWGFPGLPLARRSRPAASRGCAARARRSAELYDGYRVDHLVGFFRTYVRERERRGRVRARPSEPEQIVPGGSGARRAQRARRADHRRGSRRHPGVRARHARAPRDPRLQGAALGARLGRRRAAVQGSARLSRRAASRPAARTTPSRSPSGGTRRRSRSARRCASAVDRDGTARSAIRTRRSTTRTRDAILQLLYGAGSDIVLLPIQDVFGWKERINTPALINDDNWTWRLPWLVDDLAQEPAARDRARLRCGGLPNASAAA